MNTQWEIVTTPTVRRHPRTIVEAFPRTCEYACAVERPYSTRMDWQDRLVVAACLVALIVAVVVMA
jgi:hypothetical protein